MNENRSPLWDKKLTFVRIFVTVMIAVSFIIINNRYSEVTAATISIDEKYINNYSGEEKAKIAHEPYVYEKFAGVPESVRLDIESKIENKEDIVVSVEKEAEEIECNSMDVAGKNFPKAQLNYIQEVDEDVKDSVESEDDTTTSNTSYSYYGCLELTAYTWTGNPCADGVYPTSGHTVACNNSELWHKWIYIEGYGSYYVHDTGGMGYGVIDVYMDSYDSCIQFGRRSANIYIIN